MSRKRTVYSTELKTKLVPEAIKGEKTIKRRQVRIISHQIT